MSTYTPRNQWQGTPTDADGWVSCAAYVGAVIVDAASLGGCVPTGHQVRALSNEPTPQPGDPGLNIAQVIAALARFGCKLEDRTGGTRVALWGDLAKGRYLSVSVWYPLLGPYRSQRPGEFGHQVAIGRLEHRDRQRDALRPAQPQRAGPVGPARRDRRGRRRVGPPLEPPRRADALRTQPRAPGPRMRWT